MSLIEVTDLRKRYRSTTVVDGVSFTIGEGETYGLLGPNGAGKTTTIAMVVGVLARDGGGVRLAGRAHEVTSLATKAMIGYVPQEIALYPDLTARENLAFFGRLYGLAGRDLRRRVDEVLDVTGLSERSREAVSKYSGGMARRLNIAAGLLNRPRLLVLDEPTAGVDPQSRGAILDAVARLAGEGVAVLYTTHYMEEAERLCDRVGILDGGRMRAEGTHRELVSLVGAGDHVLITVDGAAAGAVPALERTPGVTRVDADEARLELLVAESRAVLPLILDAVTGAGCAVRSLEVREPDLEAVFLKLTGRALRD
ncbi:ABC transporter ATP-binding protein [Bailinhaonella thermotolerans]|uniref:ABC transporter ATP-binding protein n=1 Tax=Bailinhaonella thermotolerans TaxID=1070861 RepID=A0A3A4BDV5_9ACTN|nr:ABC transporter ATP-binding protein [Bailinhaonella thermotolerans]RJL32480.1 ABC transporter ATP-binding protein [Bailinhaonella thermotolerans]